MRARSRQTHAPLSPAQRRLRPRGPHSSPRGRPHAGPGARAAALLAAGPRAMPPGGRPARVAAHGRVPARPGGASPAVPPRRPKRKRRDAGSTPARQLGASGRAALRPWRTWGADAGSERLPGRRPLESALRRTCPLPGATTQSPPGAGPRTRAEAVFQAALKSVRAAAGAATRPAPGPARD